MGIWWSPDDITAGVAALRAARLIGAPTEITVLGEGFGSVALESKDSVVVLASKNIVGAEARRVSTALLPELGPALPIAVPQPLWSVDSVPGLPRGAWAYRKLSGRLLRDDDCRDHEVSLAGDVACFLTAVHSFASSLAVELGVPSRRSFWVELRRVRSDIDEVLRGMLQLSEYLRVQAWWDAFSTDSALFMVTPALVHGDLYPDNMLVSEDGSRLTGVIDWGDATVLDSAYDFAPLHHSGSSFAQACLDAYVDAGGVTDPGFRHRMRRYWELRTAGFFSFAASVREADESELEDCIRKLREGPILA